MDSQQFQVFREKLGQFYWCSDFNEFCRITGLAPDSYGLEKWQAFTTCINAMQQIPDTTWNALVEFEGL
ncbi:hypothetical protein H6G20_06230 [Desertifilum sp. FACHB-1129]|uniref:hypothetical protein n=1 Tax=unclassified Desertifilum TaxID=2621682 RepID=UPI001684684A|nr:MULTISPECIES: hypothetical protein [unclassified Desertifilum]MBD2311255.1 hypothetical protein [Desertifilum sp. FACHB-1129]MBD2324299.1 hypothetical protein [Desertifilum sp. FACHB-866]MBD2334314.1 hypothetical protein [Desertifilum sp. FACHB-868]MDA0213160.1 hypothetical protein [Cyanobacteria bacterium FC1]